MLYGMGDDDFEEPDFIRENRLNYKKVFLVILLIICITFVIVVAFNSFKDSNQASKEQLSNANNQEIIEDDIIDNVDGNTEDSFDEHENDEVNDDDNNDSNNGVVILKPENLKPVEEEIIDVSESKNTIQSHNIEEIQKQFLPQPNENSKQLIKDIYGSDEKQVYLTFDDGPSKHVTPQVLDILDENDIKATFFVLGQYVDRNPEILRREFDSGHYIANHSYTHEYPILYESKDTVFDEFRRCEESIRNALGIPEFNTYLFRFPGGSSGGRYKKVKSEARELFDTYGIAYTNWNCLTGDAAGSNTKEECLAEMIKTKGNQNSIILLMHDSENKTQTVEALPDIIKYFKDEGYVFKNFYEIFK